jgi:hypothetical protein
MGNLKIPKPSFVDKVARDLTDQEAFDLLMYLVDQDEIALDEKIQVDKSGKITYPRKGQQILVQTTMAGVDYYRASGNFSPEFGTHGAYKKKNFAPTPAFAIVLYRLAQTLAKDWGATKIVWGGVGQGGFLRRHHHEGSLRCRRRLDAQSGLSGRWDRTTGEMESGSVGSG